MFVVCTGTSVYRHACVQLLSLHNSRSRAPSCTVHVPRPFPPAAMADHGAQRKAARSTTGHLGHYELRRWMLEPSTNARAPSFVCVGKLLLGGHQRDERQGAGAQLYFQPPPKESEVSKGTGTESLCGRATHTADLAQLTDQARSRVQTPVAS